MQLPSHSLVPVVFGAILPLLLVIQISLVPICCLATNATAELDSGVCRQLSNNDVAKRLKILCVGLLLNRILLITNNLDVFELKLDSLQHTINQIYIEAKPEKLSKKWPKLYNDQMFKDIMGKVYNAFTVSNEGSQYILFTTKESLYPDLQGVDYDLTNDQVYPGLYYKDNDDQVLLSTDTKLTFYALHSNDGGLEISTYKFRDSNVVGENVNIDQTSEWKALCIRENHTIYVKQTFGGKPCQRVDWPVLKGFVVKGHFYLFGSDFIFVFDQHVYTDPSQSSGQVKKISYDGFIKCGGNLRKIVSSKKQSTMGIIIAVVLVILLICLLMALYIRKKRNDAKKRQLQQKRSGGVGSSLTLVGAAPPPPSGLPTSSPPPSALAVASGSPKSHAPSQVASNRSMMSQLKPNLLSRRSSSRNTLQSRTSSKRLSARPSSSKQVSSKFSKSSKSAKSAKSKSTKSANSGYRPSMAVTGRSGMSTTPSNKLSKT